MALWASSMCFMHAASLPFFISAFDMSRCIVASFFFAASVIFTPFGKTPKVALSWKALSTAV
jgi:hypothetical protein